MWAVRISLGTGYTVIMKEKQGGSKRPQLTPKSTASQNGSVNSAARKRGLLQPYHSLAEAVFSLEGADEIERELLAAARVSSQICLC